MVTAGTARCATCGATLTPGAQWCSLCLTPVRADEPAERAGPPPSAGNGGPPPLSALPPPATPPLIAGLVPQRRPAPQSGSESPVDPDAMIAELAASEAHRRSSLSAAMTSRRNRFLLIVAIMAVLIGGFLLASVVLARFTG